MDRSGWNVCDADGISLLRRESHRANGRVTSNDKADGPGQSIRTHPARAADRLQPQKAFGLRSGMQEVPHQSGARETHDFPGYKYLHGMPRHHREGQAFDSETRGVCIIEASSSVGSRVHGASRRCVESPPAFRGRGKMGNMPRTGSRDGADGGSHERHDNSQLPALPWNESNENRLRPLIQTWSRAKSLCEED